MEGTSKKNLRRYPYFVGLIILVCIAGAAQLLIFLDCIFPLIEYEREAVCSVMSTSAEVIAGMYGITLTGYIFFADRFRDTSQEDESLYDAVQALLVRYNRMAGFLSLMCLICFVCGEAIVLYGNNTLLSEGVYRFLVNETLLLFFVTLDTVLYFVISVLDPHKISRISTQKLEKLSKDPESGDPEAFLTDWNAIVEEIQKLQQGLAKSFRLVPARRTKPETVHTLELLRNYGRIGHNLWRDLEKLRQYHNLALHDVSDRVSKEMCDLAKKVRKELEGLK